MNEFTRELIALCRHFGVFEREAICCGTVTVQQCVALQTLLEGEREMGSLAEEAGVSGSAMTRLVDGLTRREWVERRRDPKDRRRVTVGLTPHGKEEARRLQGLTEVGVAAVLGRIPAEKHAQILESLKLIRQAVEESRALIACC